MRLLLTVAADHEIKLSLILWDVQGCIIKRNPSNVKSSPTPHKQHANDNMVGTRKVHYASHPQLSCTRQDAGIHMLCGYTSYLKSWSEPGRQEGWFLCGQVGFPYPSIWRNFKDKPLITTLATEKASEISKIELMLWNGSELVEFSSKRNSSPRFHLWFGWVKAQNCSHPAATYIHRPSFNI